MAEKEDGKTPRSFYSIRSENDNGENVEILNDVPATVEGLLLNPLYAGHLLHFCEKQYCSENVKFAMEVDKFNYEMKIEVDSSRSWKEKDVINNLSDTSYHNESSSSLQSIDILDVLKTNSDKIKPDNIRHQVIERIVFIWNTYIGSQASNQICVPAKILSNTLKRLELLHIYGNEVFSETMVDPIKTIRRDILPRYLTSDIHSNAIARISDINNFSSSINVQPPDDNPVIDKILSSTTDLKASLKSVTIDELLSDRLVYLEMLKYLRVIVASENLLCLRMVTIYKELFNTDKKAAIDHAWILLRHFIIQGAPYEVSLSHRRRREVFGQMANPSISIFDRAVKSAQQVLEQHYETFKSSSNYSSLVDQVEQYNSSKNKKSSCFGI